ncbi:hyaluronan mediated motility receptor-like isoform X10 [Dermacentor silvarum]|uniref:hyaluronan mediated motility receptor-like isoform X10 n=1 Tax=Dermacentor silvarum TaxID=543639 RepID=UPI0021019457|nr:hyaluronan mediated motility receptor-like isoform X10 [Dermacentor silvarum]
MSFPKAPRFPGGNDDVPPVGSYNPALESRTPAPKFCSATRFRDTHGASFFTPGGSYRMPPIPLHASKELLKRRLSEMAQHLEERDMLIGQLRVSKGKLHTRVSQLEELLRGLSRKVSAKNETLHGARKSKSCKASRTSRQDIEDTRALLKELGDTDTAEEAFCEVRLSKGTQELKEELNDMIDKMNADDSEAHNTDLMDAYDEENASFKTKVFLVEQELKALSNMLTNMTTEKQELEKNVADIYIERSSLREIVEDIEAKCRELHHKLVCQKKENTAKDTQIEQLVLENEVLQNKAQSLADCNEELNAVLDRVKAAKHELEEKVAETCKENSSLKASIEDLEAKHTELHHELVCQKKENTAKGTQIEQLVLENEMLQNKAQSLADCKQELNAILERVIAEKHELEEKVAETCKENSSLKASIENLEAKHTELHQELVSQKKENTAKGTQIEQLVLENEVLQNKAQSLADCKQELIALNDALTQVKLEKEEGEKRVAELHMEKTAIERSLEDLASKYHKLHHEAMQYQEEKVILYMRMDEVVKQNEVLKANVQILEGLKSKWEQQHLLLTDCIEDLQFKLDKAHCEEAELKSSVALLNREISNHEQLKQDMLKELVDFGDILTLKTSLEERLASALVEVDSLHSSNKEFAKKTSALEDANRVAQDNISELLKEKKQLEESIQSCHEIRNGIEVKLSDATRNLNIWKEKAEVLSCENRRRDEELADCAQQLKAAVLRADKYKCVCSELDRQKRELRDQLKQLSEELTQVKDEMQVAAEFYEMMVSRLSWWLSLEHFLSSNWDIHARQVNNLTEQLNSTAADAERWKTSFEALQMRVSPFQEQLELYELEKQLLERRNEATESELSKLHEKVSKMMGHQNHKQKIRYLSNLLKERDDFKKELYTLRQKTLKQTKEIVRLELQLSQKLKQGQKGLFDHSAKENVLPKPPM